MSRIMWWVLFFVSLFFFFVLFFEKSIRNARVVIRTNMLNKTPSHLFHSSCSCICEHFCVSGQQHRRHRERRDIKTLRVKFSSSMDVKVKTMVLFQVMLTGNRDDEFCIWAAYTVGWVWGANMDKESLC